jgi:hypothetical protein
MFNLFKKKKKMFTKSKETTAVQGIAVGAKYKYDATYNTENGEATNLALTVSKDGVSSDGSATTEEVGTIENDGENIKVNIPSTEDVVSIIADYASIVSEIGGIHNGGAVGKLV